jgi:hypothetical protein
MKYVPSADINIENKIAVTMLNEVLIWNFMCFFFGGGGGEILELH